jgi:hypothetical protein
MNSSTFGTSLEPSSLIVLGAQRERSAPPDDVFMEHPTGAFRGLAFAIIFNVLLICTGTAAWILWKLIR